MKYILPVIKVIALGFVLLAIPTGTESWFRLIRLIIASLLAIEIFLFFKLVFYDNSIRKRVKNWLFSVTILCLMLIALEVIFMFIPRSHTVGYTTACKNWFHAYWNPINSFGFRDAEPDKKKASVLFIGDSFTSGHGIKKIEQRFSNIVGKQLKGKQAINIGRNGVDTQEEFQTMIDFIRDFESKPDKIVLQYFGNDIDNLAFKFKPKNRTELYQPYKQISGLRYFIITRSYLVNYFFWLFPHGDTRPYLNTIKNAYENENLFLEHLSQLDQFIQYSQQNSIDLIVVVYPYLQSLETSKNLYTDKIIAHFKGHHIPTIDVAKLVEDMPPKARVVNSNDAHASVEVNQRVADALLEIID